MSRLNHTRRTPYDEEFPDGCQVARAKASSDDDITQPDKVKTAIARAHTLIQANPADVERLFRRRSLQA